MTLSAMLMAGVLAMNANTPEYFVKSLVFPENTDSVTKIEMASRLTPSPEQLAWQDLELTAFMHFGPNTFTDREWGDGKEDPKVFNPTDLDCDQWVRVLKDAGFNMVILTAKHHDGFCLWPTRTTKHSVKSSKWKNGKGDVVAELRKACDKYGMKLGLYLSPWDRNAPQYGDSPKYNDLFVAQLTELLTNYGKIDEVWFDGACGEGPNGKKQEYDWNRVMETIHQLQPDAVTAIMGDDVRWVGNERGYGRETEWSVTALNPESLPNGKEKNAALGISGTSKDLGSRALIAKADEIHWYPSEVDVSIRPGWFFHANQNPHSLAHLADIYLSSVGRNSVLLLNIPPDTDGRIHASDEARLKEFGKWIKDNFSDNLIVSEKGGIAYTNGSPLANAVILQEDIAKGQRVEEFDIIGLVDGAWRTLASGTTIGKKRILMFPEAKVDAVIVSVKSERAKANLLPTELYHVTLPEKGAQPTIGFPLAEKADWTTVLPAKNAIDNDKATTWRSATDNALTINLGKEKSIAGFVYTPPTEANKDGMIYKYKLETSTNGKKWTEIPLSGEFSNILNNPIEQVVYLPKVAKAKFVRLTSLESANGSEGIAVGEFSIITK